MAAQFTYQILSASTNGRPIPVVQTATLGTLIHTTEAGVVSTDEIYLFASNVTAAAVPLTIEWGAAGVGSQIVHLLTIPANSSRMVVVNAQPLNNGLVVTAFAGTASAINLTGYVLRIS